MSKEVHRYQKPTFIKKSLIYISIQRMKNKNTFILWSNETEKMVVKGQCIRFIDLVLYQTTV